MATTALLRNRAFAQRTFLLCLLPYAWVVANAWRTFSGYSLFYISLGILLNSAFLAILFLATESGLIRVESLRSRIRLVLWPLAAFFVTGSFVYNFLVFMPWSQVHKLASLPLVFALALTAMFSRRAFRAITFGLCLAILIAAVQTSMRNSAIPADAARDGHAALQLDVAKNRPNIYLLMFDAMSGSAHYIRTQGDVPPWRRFLADRGFREVTGALSSRPYSVQSVIDILQERPMIWHDFGESPALESAGMSIDSPSPGVDHAHQLGYRVAFLYQNNYFGRLHPLRNLDAYQPERSIGLCSLAPTRVGMHLCRGTNTVVERLIGADDEVHAHRDETLRFMDHVIRGGHPWIVWSYIAVPEHTSLTYREYLQDDRDEFNADHRANSHRTVEIMHAYLDLIRARDPNAIVVVFGDHGLIRSRGWETDAKVRELFPRDLRTQDERSIGLFIHPADFCTDKLREGYALQNLLADLLQCTNLARVFQIP